jgi:nanoRNase/pAp phosphatase (c-di-AMP/oligoRNAs hydrolase)
MMLAAKLMKYKADQATIIRHLYKTKPLSFMKLWGKIMARLNWNKEYKIVWSLVSGEDFVQSHASESDIPLILEEIQKSFSQGQIFAVLYSYGNSRTKAQFKIPNTKIRQKIINVFEESVLEANETICIETKEQDLIKAEKNLIEKIKQINDDQIN